MVSAQSVIDQLKQIKYNYKGWNRAEAGELASILLPDEEIFECVNGWYEGGIGLLCATNIRVLLIDKKPFRFLNVEDVRFDTINQIDYNHRLMDARICITTGLKSLTFRSYNQPRLRKLISHVQHRMAEIKSEQVQHTETQQEHLRQIDHQLKAYLVSQYQQGQTLKRYENVVDSQPIANQQEFMEGTMPNGLVSRIAAPDMSKAVDASSLVNGVTSNELFEDGIKEVFGKYSQAATSYDPIVVAGEPAPIANDLIYGPEPVEDSDFRIAYSKLPMIVKRRVARRQTLA